MSAERGVARQLVLAWERKFTWSPVSTSALPCLVMQQETIAVEMVMTAKQTRSEEDVITASVKG